MTIDTDEIKSCIRNHVGMWCTPDAERLELAQSADAAIAGVIDNMVVAPEHIKVVWPWIEGHKIKLRTWFEFAHGETDINQISRNINLSLRAGADGAVIFIELRDLSDFASDIESIRNDLFFNKHLAVGLDIGEINSGDWDAVFDALVKMRADSVMFAYTKKSDKNSDFVGRVCGMLNAWNNDFAGDVHWFLGDNFIRIEQAMRLTQCMHNELWPNMRFFMSRQ